jgi:hypothetical protein
MAQALTDLLSRFGVDYQNAPEPTPALLAFMRGLGMTLDTAETSRRTNELRMKERATQAREEITRQDERTKIRMAGDLQSRGVLNSGETNTRVARQAEDVAKREGQVEQTLAEGIESGSQAFMATQDALRQQALEKVLGVETQNSIDKATAEAQEKAWLRQTEAADLAYQRQKEAQDAAYQAQEDMLRKYGLI